MPRFSYQALDEAGTETAGEIEAASLTAAIDQLTVQGLQILEIRIEKPGSASEPAAAGDRQGTHAADQPSATRQTNTPTPALQTALENAIRHREQLVPALHALASELPRGSTRRDLIELADALPKASHANDLLVSKRAASWLPMLLVGLTNRTGHPRLAELIATAARESERRNNRLRLLAYPIVLSLVAFGVFALLCAWVVPSFEVMFADFGIQVPPLTMFVISVSYLFRQHLPATLVVLLLLIFAMYGISRLCSRYSLGYRLFGRLAAGSSSAVAAIAALSGQLAELIDAGVSVPEAIQIAGDSCRHAHFRKVAQQLAQDAKRMNVPLRSSIVASELPGNLLYALDPPGATEANVAMLRELSAMYRQRETHRIDWLAEASSYLAVIAVGFAVGVITIAMFFPLINLVSMLT